MIRILILIFHEFAKIHAWFEIILLLKICVNLRLFLRKQFEIFKKKAFSGLIKFELNY